MRSLKKDSYQKIEDLILLVPPLIGLLLVILEMGSFLELGLGGQKSLRAVSNIVTFDTTHVAFSYILLATSKQYKSWFQEARPYKNFWMVIFLIFSILSFSEFELIKLHNYVPKKWISLFFKLFWLLVPLLHSYYQSIGIFLARLSNENKEYKMIRKFLYYSSYPIVLMSLSENFLYLKNYTDVHFVSLLYVVLTVIWLIFFILSVLYAKESISIKEKIYLVRFVFWPLMLHSDFAAIFIGVIHGTEYLFFYLKIRNIDSGVKKSVLASILIFGFVLILAVNGSYHKLILAQDKANLWFFPWMQSLFWIITASHYLLDHLMYRMKYPVSRKYFGKLLQSTGF